MTDERLCKNCLRWLPVERFQKGAFNRNGRPYVRYTCKDCVSFRRACQRAGAASVKGQSRTCKQCGTRKPLSAFYMNSGGTRRWTCGQCCITNKRERIHAMRRDDRADRGGGAGGATVRQLEFILECVVYYVLIVLFAAFLFWGVVLIAVGLSGGKLP